MQDNSIPEMPSSFFQNHEEISTTPHTPLLDEAIENINQQAQKTMNTETQTNGQEAQAEDLKSTAAHKEINIDTSNFEGWSKKKLEYTTLFCLFLMVALISVVIGVGTTALFIAVMTYFGLKVSIPVMIAFEVFMVGLTYLSKSKLAELAIWMTKYAVEGLGWVVVKTRSLVSKISSTFQSFKNIFKKKEENSVEAEAQPA